MNWTGAAVACLSRGVTTRTRLRRERSESSWFGSRSPYDVSGCYRWVLGQSVDDALDQDSVASVRAVGVAVGRGSECIMIRIEAGDVNVWAPSRVSLEPGEVGCSAAAAASVTSASGAQ